MKHTVSKQPNAAPDRATSTTYTLIPPKDAVTTAPTTAAKSDDDGMSTPVKKS